MPREESTQHHASHFISSLLHQVAGLECTPLTLNSRRKSGPDWLTADHSSRIKLTAVLSLNRASVIAHAEARVPLCVCVCVCYFDRMDAMRTLIGHFTIELGYSNPAFISSGKNIALESLFILGYPLNAKCIWNLDVHSVDAKSVVHLLDLIN